MYRSLKSFYFSQRKNYSLSDDFIIDEFIFGDEKISFRLLTNSDDIGIEELIVLDKELHEIFNGREVDFSVQNFSKSEYPYKYFYYINYDEFVNEVQKLLKNHGFSLTNSDRINFLEDYIEIFISNSLCRFKLISNSFLDDLKEFISGKFTEDIELIMLNCLMTREEKSCEKLDNKLENKRKEIKQENKIKAEKVKVNKESTEENSLFRLGKKISDKDLILKISDLDQNSGFCKIQGRVYDLEIRELKSGKKLALFDIEDETSAMNCKWFLDEKKLSIFNNNINKDSIKKGIYVTAIGRVEYDQYAKGISMMIDGMEKSSSFVYIDNAPEKRVELHLNSQMSGLDGCVNLEVLKSRLEEMGHTAVGVTDIGVVQAYPKMMDLFGKSDIKALYGLELNLLEDNPRILYNYKDGVNFDTFVVFDIETTGLSHLKNNITEIGAVRVESGKIVDVFNELVNPEQEISQEITEITGITNEMVADKPLISEIMPKFLEFSKNAVFVAHNAEFDISFIKTNCKRLNLEFNPTFIDTMGFARAILPHLKNHKLNTLCKELGVNLLNHHRASFDAEACAGILLELIKIVEKEGKVFDENINNIETKWPVAKNISYNSIIYVKKMEALSGFYKMVSEGLMKYFRRVAGFPKSRLKEYREGLLIGSGNWDGELFRAFIEEKSEEEILEIAKFYDFFEIQPISNLKHLFFRGKVLSIDDLKEINKKIYELGKKLDKLVVATGNVKYLDKNDYIFRNVILYGQGRKNLEKEGSFYFRTTDEMFDEFSYLGKDEAYEVVVKNTNIFKDMLEDILPIPNGTYPPFIEGSDEELRKIC